MKINTFCTVGNTESVCYVYLGIHLMLSLEAFGMSRSETASVGPWGHFGDVLIHSQTFGYQEFSHDTFTLYLYFASVCLFHDKILLNIFALFPLMIQFFKNHLCWRLTKQTFCASFVRFSQWFSSHFSNNLLSLEKTYFCVIFFERNESPLL